MARIPTTSMTLLRDVASDSQHARWSEFVERYRPMMEAYLHERFPHVDADDMVQETLVALIKSMPAYRYVPEETGHFLRDFGGGPFPALYDEFEWEGRAVAVVELLEPLELSCSPDGLRLAGRR